MGNRLKDKVLKRPTAQPDDEVGFAKRFGFMPAGEEKEAQYGELYTAAKAAPNPRTMKQVFENIDALPETIPESRQKFYSEAKDELKKTLKSINEKYTQNSKATEWAQVGEILGQALTQFAAAHQGLRTGVDISSGLKFKPTDWNAKQKLLMDRLRQSVDSVDKNLKGVEREEDSETKAFGRERDRIANAQLRKLFEEIAAGRKDIKSAEDKESKVDKLANAEINKWSKAQQKKNQAIQDSVAAFESIEARKDLLDEEKYDSMMKSKIEQVARKSKVPSRRLLQAWETIKEFQDKDADELPEGAATSMSDWMSRAGNSPTEITDERAILGIKAYVDPTTSVEKKRMIKQKLLEDYQIELP